MAEREWTGSVAKLPEAMAALAIEMSNLGARDDELDPLELAKWRVEMMNFLRDHAYTLSEWAQAVEQLYARLDHELANGVTVAQAITCGMKVLPRDTMHVTMGGAGLPDSYLYVTYTNDPFVLGIDREGRASS